jgi:hypothetical protein
LERRVKFEEAISAKRRGWHSPFRTICEAGFWKPMRQERGAFAPWRLSSASVGDTARRSVCGRWACGLKRSLHAAERETEANLERRQQFLAAVAAVPPEKLKFLDESGVTTQMTRWWGRAPKANV